MDDILLPLRRKLPPRLDGSKVRLVGTTAAVVLAAPFYAQAAPAPTLLHVPPATHAVLASAPCFAEANRSDIEIIPSGKRQLAIFTAPPADYGSISVAIQSGKVAPASGAPCAATETQQFVITGDQAQKTSPEVLGKAFTILMKAFVLALLLEQALALLFNWRLVQEFIIGKAWRTPIMFGASLALAFQMDFDLVTQLSNAYGPARAYAGDALTWGLTAAILAGGSVGVNRLLTGLGFRTQVRPDLVVQPDLNQAWMAIWCNRNANIMVCIAEADPPPADVPTLAALLGNRSIFKRLRDLFFPNSQRFPKSGGYLVRSKTAYRIYVILPDAQIVDAKGILRNTIADVPCLQFASRAVVDLYIKLP